MGSNPISHPNIISPKDKRHLSLGRSQGVRHGSLTPAFVGSNPAAPAKTAVKLPGYRPGVFALHNIYLPAVKLGITAVTYICDPGIGIIINPELTIAIHHNV